MMIRAFALCLICVLSGSPAFARLMDRNVAEKLLLTDLLDIRNSRYLEGHAYSRFPGPEKRLRIPPVPHQDPLSILHSGEYAVMYTVQPNDSLRKIARRYGTTVEFIKQLNRLSGSRLRAGQRLSVWDQPFTIRVDKTFNRLYLWAGDVLIKEYPVSTGKQKALTPVGTFFIQSRYPYPTWFHKGTVVPGGSPDNFLGTRWLGFDKPQFGIHGTIFPELIGRPVSKGCIRMKNEDVEELYEFISVGTAVIISEE